MGKIEEKICKTECRTKEGLTVGLIDSIITSARALMKINKGIDLHDQDSDAIMEAMNDLKDDEDVSWLLTRKTSKQRKEDERMINIAVQSIIKDKTPIKF